MICNFHRCFVYLDGLGVNWKPQTPAIFITSGRTINAKYNGTVLLKYTNIKNKNPIKIILNKIILYFDGLSNDTKNFGIG